MKKALVILIVSFQLIGCSSAKGQKTNTKVSGVYEREESSEKLELKSDGTYTLWNPEITFTPVIEQCDYASTGKWTILADNVIEITSENYYTEQKGFGYDLKKENKLSQDSLYIQVVFPTDFHPVSLNFTFNHKNNKSITTDKTYIVLPKSKYLWNRRTATNQISFNLNADVSGTEIYKGRILFKIFEESIDTEIHNYLTITLPCFDRCFFEFEPFYQDLILIKNKNTIIWQGDTWSK
ncbi:hypothetical protein [Macellibacteroides fermentans]|uniref:Uncharacterized protein n=1 Tax=Parabacteroides chartae TaxID=1037355 RepID=A0A1T5D997_9BACT|nr:hypothetical protein [Parabacteroides chartae]SKB68060.1 hypothetical protein SAMN05660349_02311 [Parabacteroides chartae]